MKGDDIDKVVRALSKVPETRLLLIELAREVVNETGDLDVDKVKEKQREINLAVAEARAYAKGVKRACDVLSRLPARQGEAGSW